MTSQLTPILDDRLHLLEGIGPFTGPPSEADFAVLMSFAAPVDGYESPVVDVTDTVAPGPHGDIPVRVYRSLDVAPTHGLVWAHGGAFVAGDLDMPESDVVARELCTRAPIVVVAVDYRLCNDGIHFPVPHDDVHAAFVWASTEAALLAPGSPWAIGGASAGGNLAAGVAQRLRDEHEDASALVLAYPVVHHQFEVDEELRRRLETLPSALGFPDEVKHGLNANFLGGADPEVTYAFAGDGDVTGLPPTLVTVGDHDDLGPTGLAFVRRLVDSGVIAELEYVKGVPHGHLNIPGLPEALGSIERIADFVIGAEGRTGTAGSAR